MHECIVAASEFTGIMMNGYINDSVGTLYQKITNLRKMSISI